jgi:hypothetical protein
VLADRLSVDTIDREGRLVVIKFRAQARVDLIRLIKVVSEQPGATLVPPASLKLDLEAQNGSGGPGRAGGPKGPPLQVSKVPGPSRVQDRRGGPSGPPGRETSWWTARATAGEVTAGFTKAEILRKPEANPRAEGGMFARLEELLRALG